MAEKILTGILTIDDGRGGGGSPRPITLE